MKIGTKKASNPRPAEETIDPVLQLIDVDRACAELCKQDFSFFVKEFWDVVVKDPLIWNWHLDYIIRDLEEIAFNLLKGKPKTDYILNIFPGASKSSILSKLFPCWLWAVYPEMVVVTVSYGDKVSNDNARGSRDIIESTKYKKYFPGIKIRSDFNQVEHYKNTLGGERISTTPQGALTGFHGHIIICDELQNVKKASSQIERETLNTWLQDTLPSRKKNLERTSTIFCQQRLHVDDSSGFLMRDGGTYKRLCIPVEIDKSLYPVELLKHYKEGLAFPERFPRSVLNELKEKRGGRIYNTQFLMNPSSDKDSLIKETMFKIIQESEFQEIKKGKNAPVIFYLDSGVGESKKNDPSAILACMKVEHILYITSVATVKLEFTKLLQYMETFVNENGGTTQSKIYVEPKATGPAIVSSMRSNSSLNVIKGADPRDSKRDRLEAIVPTLEGGKVVLVDNGKWNIEKFMSEVTATNPIHDDMRDVLTAAVTSEIINKPSNIGAYGYIKNRMNK